MADLAKRVTIPNTDLAVAPICCGGTIYLEFEDAPQYRACLDCYTELGGNFIDTANVYGKWLKHGQNSGEIMLGDWLAARGNRHDVVLASKAAHPEFATMDVPRMRFKEITADLDESLAALQTDYLDILWLHRDAESVPVGEIVDMMTRLCESGKIRYFGCSNWKPERIEQALAYAEKTGARRFIANQPRWSLARWNALDTDDKTLAAMDEAGLRMHERTGMAAVPYSSQANGFFTKYDAGQVSEKLAAKFVNEDNTRIYRNMKALSAETGWTCTEIALAWLMSHRFPVIPIIGSRTPLQIQESAAAANIRLNEEQMAALLA